MSPKEFSDLIKRTHIEMILFEGEIVYYYFSAVLMLPIKMGNAIGYFYVLIISDEKDVVELLRDEFF